MDSGRLWLDAETMRRLGRETVDAIAERLTRPWDATPVVTALSPEELAARLQEPAPEDGRPFDQLLLLAPHRADVDGARALIAAEHDQRIDLEVGQPRPVIEDLIKTGNAARSIWWRF